MIITKLNLTNFRNYQKLNLELSPNMNIFIGENGVGKTNILEAASVLALTKSYRIGNDMDLIRFTKQKAKIKGSVKKGRTKKDLAIEIMDKQKKVLVNNKQIKRIADYIANLNVVIFTPNDLEIMTGSPSIRRNLLNMELSQISLEYLKISNEYNKLLKTRNEYLKILFTNNIADKTYLDILTEKLVEKAVFIYKMRHLYLEKIGNNIDAIFKNITDSSGVELLYKPNIEIEVYEEDAIRRALRHKFHKYYKKELAYGMTLYGPHRDDFTFSYKGKDMKVYASQGQQKSAVLSYKLATIKIFEEYSGSSPVLLLDDIFSELDLKKKNKLLKFISKDIQSIITTTDLKNISKKALDNVAIFQVSNGNVERCEKK